MLNAEYLQESHWKGLEKMLKKWYNFNSTAQHSTAQHSG